MIITEPAIGSDNSVETFRHRQWGIEMMAVLCICAMVVIVAKPYIPFEFPHYLIAVCFLIIAWLFSSLLIAVEEGYLRWRFGPGLVRGQVALGDIRSAQRVRLRWYRSWGIRLTRNGWLYNVTGRKAVLIELKSGKQFILGCERPDKLVRALLEQFSHS